MPSIAARLEPIAPTPAEDSAAEEMLRLDAEDDAGATTGAAPLQFTVFPGIEAAEGTWRALERTAVLTPYQRYDWIAALLQSRPLGGERCAVAVVHDAVGPLALFPLAIGRRFGVRTAEFIGTKIGNADWPVLERRAAARLTPAVLRQLFREIGRQAGGLDMVSLHNQPQSWLGVDNPMLAFPHQPGPDHFYLAPIAPGAAADRLNSKRIRNLQRGRRRLEETMGPVVLRRARSVDEIAKVHAAFLEQRELRFAQMGVRNVFAEGWFVDFFKRAAAASLGSDRPAVRFDALYAGDTIVATSCGACCGSHYSQYINSTASGPAARYSLMGILMYDLLAELSALGVTSIDMGLGDFDYKADWTDRQTAYDSVIAVTPAGRLAAPVLRGLRGLKREIKQNDKLYAALKRLRALTHRNKHRSELAAAPDSEEGN